MAQSVSSGMLARRSGQAGGKIWILESQWTSGGPIFFGQVRYFTAAVPGSRSRRTLAFGAIGKSQWSDVQLKSQESDFCKVAWSPTLRVRAWHDHLATCYYFYWGRFCGSPVGQFWVTRAALAGVRLPGRSQGVRLSGADLALPDDPPATQFYVAAFRGGPVGQLLDARAALRPGGKSYGSSSLS